jgi:GNAT superfamily N-acetyltransferase
LNTSILIDATHANLSRAIEENEHELFILAGRQDGKILADQNDICWVVARPSWPNFMFKPKFKIDSITQRLQHLGGEIERRRIPPVIKVGPGAEPVDLAGYLQDNGFVDMNMSRPGLAIDLDRIRGDFKGTPGLSVKRVESAERVEDWIRLATEGIWVLEPDFIAGIANDPAVELYVGILGGEVVGVSLLFLAAGVAGIHLVSVPPMFRGRGIGSAMTIIPLLNAKKIGYKIATLQATDVGESLYRRIGFEEYCRFALYRWEGRTYDEFMGQADGRM